MESQRTAVDVLGKAAQCVERGGERTTRGDDLQQPLLAREQGIGLLARADVPKNEIGSVLVVAQLNPLPGDVSVKPGTVLASPNDFPFHLSPGEQIRILGEGRFETIGHDQIAKAVSDGLFRRVAEDAREFAIDAQNPGIPQRRQYDRVGRQLEQLVEIRRLPEQLSVRSLALRGVGGKPEGSIMCAPPSAV